MKNSIFFGVLTGLAIILSFMSSEWLLLKDVFRFGFLPFIAIFIYLAMKKRKKGQFNGTITYGQCFLTGFYVAVVASIIVALFSFSWFEWFHVDSLNVGISQQARIAAARHINGNQFSAASRTIRAIAPFSIAIGFFVVTLIFSIIISLLMSAFVKTRNKRFPTTSLQTSS